MNAYSRDEIASMTAEEFDYYPDTLWGAADLVAELGQGRYRGMELTREAAGVWNVKCACGAVLTAYVGDHPRAGWFDTKAAA
jgi:hypothetical protein